MSSSELSDILSPELVKYVDSCVMGYDPWADDNKDVNYKTEVQMDDESKLNENIMPLPLYPPSLKDATPFSNEPYMGLFRFKISTIRECQRTKSCEYSSLLNKLYVKKAAEFPINFYINDYPAEKLFIRITPQYSDQKNVTKLVRRCVQHEFVHPGDYPRNSHVFGCTNKDTQYLGDTEKNERLSVVIPLTKPQIGLDYVTESFYFVCINSCIEPGINRKSLKLIFTLENINGNVFGRQCLNVRICALPTRDRRKDETNTVPATGLIKLNRFKVFKKRKLHEASDESDTDDRNSESDKIFQLNIPIVGAKNVERIFDYVQALNANEIVNRAGTSTGNIYQQNRETIKAIRSTMGL